MGEVYSLYMGIGGKERWDFYHGWEEDGGDGHGWELFELFFVFRFIFFVKGAGNGFSGTECRERIERIISC
jgi:hypothetical protein